MAEFEIRQELPRHAVTIRKVVGNSEVAQAFGECLPKVFGYIQSKGGAMSGPPFGLYHSFSDDKMDMEAGLPVEAPVEGEGEITSTTLPGGRVAATWHVGPYEQLAQAHESLRRWVDEQGLRPAGPPRDVFWTDPGQEPDPSKWRTEVVLPVE
ncbi:MAG TPA: GyrI-like domain-containing protein [Actinomycetota bacterium]|nr:GyrI-like domain-containing protein [Actinomycetota bacterium]